MEGRLTTSSSEALIKSTRVEDILKPEPPVRSDSKVRILSVYNMAQYKVKQQSYNTCDFTHVVI